MKNSLSPWSFFALVGVILFTSCTIPTAAPPTSTASLASTMIDDYISKIAATDFSKSSWNKALVNNRLSTTDVQALKASIITRLTADGLLTSRNVDQIAGSMMSGISTGVSNLAAGSLANDYRTGSVLISVAIQSAVQSVATHSTEVSSTSVKLTDVVGGIMKTGVTSLSTMAGGDVVAVQSAILQSVKDVATATASITPAANSTSFINAAVTATVQVALSSQSSSSASLMQAAFAGAASSIQTTNSAAAASSLQDIVSTSIRNAATNSSTAQSILVQAAIGLSSSASSTASTTDVSSVVQGAAQTASTGLGIAIDTSTATAAAVEIAPTAVLTADLGTAAVLPYLGGCRTENEEFPDTRNSDNISPWPPSL